MSEQRCTLTRLVGSSVTRRRRLLIGAVGALGASGLILGGMGVPVSAGDVNVVGNPHASVDVQDGCVTASAGTGGAGGSVDPQPGTDASGLGAAGQGTATVSICRDDLGGPLPDDPGGSLPDDLERIVSDELDDVVPDQVDDVVPGDLDDLVPGEGGGSLEGEVVGVVTAALEGGLPGDGDGSIPGALDDIVPGDGDGSFPAGPGDLLGGLGGSDPGGNGGGPGGNGGAGPAVNTSTNGSVSESVAVGGVGAERGGPTDVAPGAEIDGGAPALVGAAVPPGATLPRTGGGLGNGVLRLVALLGLGRALVGLAQRRLPAVGAGQG